MVLETGDLFGPVLEYPDPDAQRRFDGLVGIDAMKADIVREAQLLLDASVLTEWSQRHYKRVIPVVNDVAGRTPLIESPRVTCSHPFLGRGSISPPVLIFHSVSYSAGGTSPISP